MNRPVRPAMNNAPARDDHWSVLLEKIGFERDERAFAELYEHFSPLIRGFCINQSGLNVANEASEEVVQEVMFKVWQKAPMYNSSKAAASTWIYTIMRNSRIDLMRKNRRHQHSDLDPIEAEDLWEEESENQSFVYLQNARNKAIISQSFAELPIEQRQALGQVYMQGKSHSEIADQEGLPLGTVKSRVRMGLQKLKQSMGRTQ